MSVNLGEMIVSFTADTSKLVAGIDVAKASMGGLANIGAVGIAAGALVGLGVAAAGVGVYSLHMAADFQQGVNRMVTGAGDVTDNMAKMGQGMLAVSVDTGILTGGTQGLNAAMYLIISSGQRGAMALDTLAVAARAAQIEQASVVDVANVLSGVMTNYGTKTFNATQFMNGLIAAVQRGKITLQELAVAMGPLDPIAQSLGIHFQDVAAAMTTQTNAMIPAERAATGLRFMMLALENPTKKATDAMAALGLKSEDVANEMKTSLPGALQMIYDAAKRAGPEGSVPFDRAVSDMVGGIRSFTAFTALTGPHMKDFTHNAQLILSAMQQNKGAVTGWDVAQSNFNIKLAQASAASQALFIAIGTQLLPVLTPMVGKINPIVTQLTVWISSGKAVADVTHAWATATGAVSTALSTLVNVFNAVKTGLAGIAVVIATVVLGFYLYQGAALLMYIASVAQMGAFTFIIAELATMAVAAYSAAIAFLAGIVPALIATATAAWATAIAMIAATWPFLLIGAAIAIAVVGLVLLYAHFAPVRAAVASIGATFMQLAGILMSSLAPVWPILTASLASLWQSFQQVFAALKPAMPLFMLLGAILGGVLAIAIGILIGLLMGLAKGLAFLVAGIAMVLSGIIMIISGFITVVLSIFGMFFGLLQGLFTGNWGPFLASWHNFLQGLLTIVQGLMTAIVGVFIAVFGTIWGVVSGFIQGVIAFFVNLYHALVGGSIVPDMVTGILTWFNNLVTEALNFITNLVTGILTWFNNLLSQVLSIVGNMVVGILVWMVQMEVMVLSTVSLMVTIFLSWLGNLLNQGLAFIGNLVIGILVWMVKMEVMVLATVTLMVTIFLTWLGNLVTQGGAKVQSLVTTITTFLGQLPGIALNAGIAFMQGLINGIGSMISNLIGTMGSVISAITSHLPRSPAEKGPLRDLNKYGPAFVAGLSEGIVKTIPTLQAAVDLMVKPMAQVAPQAYPQGGAITSSAITLAASQAQGSSANNAPVVLMVDGRVLGEISGKYQAKTVQVRTGLRQY